MGMDNIDFELMETTLREEEESRHHLEAENKDLKMRIEEAERQLVREREQRREEVEEVKKRNEELEEEIRNRQLENSQKMEELLKEFSDSSLRCARQQELVEKKQERVEELQDM